MAEITRDTPAGILMRNTLTAKVASIRIRMISSVLMVSPNSKKHASRGAPEPCLSRVSVRTPGPAAGQQIKEIPEIPGK
jgi:hypothetical protein